MPRQTSHVYWCCTRTCCGERSRSAWVSPAGSTAQERLIALAPDVILNGHDHEEAAAQLGDRIAVSTAGTLTHRMRGGKPSVFNVVRIEPGTVTIQHWRWQDGDAFAPSDRFVVRAHEPRGRPAAGSDRCRLTPGCA